MMNFLKLLGQWKVILLLTGALLLLAYALTDVSSVLKEDVSLRQQSIDADKAVADKTKKIMDYDPSKARLVKP
ncbi:MULTISPECIES: hypothetical protein [Phyllobacterium]|jgi:hypothetical protein|uniref:hypothetical protein n=1 Tax=Phyllobacterium TaxID=28100 RepID=UPI001CBBADCD|nr:hypothetical protein [Phyllobacterium calauticae]MBZ3695488.1 hypothetical protein [Phyllobacterium calauticae]